MIPIPHRHLSRRDFLRGILLPTLTWLGVRNVALTQAQDEDFTYEVTELELTLPRLAPAFDGFTLIQISDLHYNGEGMRAEWLRRVVDDINQHTPDVIVLTGDYPIRGDEHFSALIPEIAAELVRLQAREAVLAVYGNHDMLNGLAQSRDLMEQSEITELINKVYTVQRDGAALYIAGLDDYNYGRPDLNYVAAQMPTDDAAISLIHEPDYADVVADFGRFDLQLSGHSHGGQIRTVDGVPLTLPRNGQKYPNGLYEINGMFQYTNRGLGTKPPHIRVNCPAEITIFTLRSP